MKNNIMKPSEISVVEAFVSAINHHSLTEMSDLMTEDHTFIDSSGRVETGREKMIAGWEGYFRMFPDFMIKIENILGAETLVAAFGSASGTYNGKRGLISENKIEMTAAWKAIVVNGKIKHWQVYTDWTEGKRIIDEDRTAS